MAFRCSCPMAGQRRIIWCRALAIITARVDASSLAAAIRLFLAQGPSGHLANASVAAIDTRTMDAHFADLFTLYEATRRSLPIAA